VAGWQWIQAAQDNYYSIVIKPYFKPAFYFKSEFKLYRLYDHIINAYIEQFNVDFFYSILFHQSGRVCFGLGWDLAQIALKVLTKFTFKQCSKTLINDICDLKTNWLGDSAMWLEKCEDESSP